jgi:hypothetical protein
MKKSLFFFFCWLSLAPLTFAQVGLGVGSNGLNFKTSAQSRYFFLARGYVLTFAEGNPVGSASVGLMHRFLREEKARMYYGATIGTSFGNGNSELGQTQRFTIPFGVEYLPFESRLISLSLEGGPSAFRVAETYGLTLGWNVEFTYYFARKRKN